MFKDDKNWHVPYMVDQMLKADDLFFDAVSQIRMPIWSSGRVVLTGDAAHATSFLSGQGSSCALVSAYVLAGELATHAHYRPEERRGGKECVSTCRSWGEPDH